MSETLRRLGRAGAIVYRAKTPQRYPICRKLVASTAVIKIAHKLPLLVTLLAKTAIKANAIAGKRTKTLNLSPSRPPIRNIKTMSVNIGMR